jgi:aspartate carbamoyltransferase regulatory subunit
MSEEKGRKLKPIKNGTVLDHLPAASAIKILNILNLEYDHPVSILINNNSNKIGKKDLIFIENRTLNEDEVSKIGLIAKNSTWNIIENGKVIKKEKIHLPLTAFNLINCPNENCITNHEDIETKFDVNESDDSVTCEYCGREIENKNILKNLK